MLLDVHNKALKKNGRGNRSRTWNQPIANHDNHPINSRPTLLLVWEAWYIATSVSCRLARLTWGSLSYTASCQVWSKACVPPPLSGSRRGHSSGSLRASTARWPWGRTGPRCFADSRHRSTETAASEAPHPRVPCGSNMRCAIM